MTPPKSNTNLPLLASDLEITNWQQKYDHHHLLELAEKQKQRKELNDKEIDKLNKELEALEVQMAYKWYVISF
ncbi:hypothetical protein [Spiroplasma mirum]|uniref:hypothetical protein n=1 Tax=Spiroplasma mirum TaxID=2144 RepID=UPI0003E00F47|nr:MULTISPECIES: hypothetical protein [Spiroplasma]AHF61081.1 hypothetical protein SMM_0659 [Spiroplasma mirum ATCC 29335]